MAAEQKAENLSASVERNAIVSANLEASSKSLSELISGQQFSKLQSGKDQSDKEDAMFGGGQFDFGSSADIYGTGKEKTLLAQASKEILPSVAQGWSPDYVIEQARQKSNDYSHKMQDGKNATNNEEFLDMFLHGSGNDRQMHSKRGEDAMLDAFIKSPGAEAIRKQYAQAHCPAFTDKLGYGTFDAFKETMLPQVGESGVKLPDYSRPGVHVGGFGKPPKDYPWAATTATRCNAEGKANKNGDHVQFQVINLAGEHSWFYHLPGIKDKPVGEAGPRRTIVEVFKWTDELPKQRGTEK